MLKLPLSDRPKKMQLIDSTLTIQAPLTCAHCAEPIVHLYTSKEYSDDKGGIQKSFCCQGCLTVYQVLNAKGLEEFYEIKQNSAIFKRRSPVELKEIEFRYLDDKDFLNEFSYVSADQLATMEFYLEGIHCLACLWLIEKLPHLVEDVINAKLDLDKSIVTISLKPNGLFSKAASELNQLGYKPHPLKKNQQTHEFKLKEERQYILRIGLAAAGASNIMLYAVSLYAGASNYYATLFHWLTVIFALPVLTYSAFPFYRNAWQSLKNKNLSIDVPISLSLIIGGIMGVTNLFLGIHDNYFDSLTTLVFLLLISRYFLKKIQEKALSAKDIHFFNQTESVLRASDITYTQFEQIHSKFIKNGDVLKIKQGEMLPADGEIIKGETCLNTSLLTGEAHPVFQKLGSKVYAGTQNISEDILIRVTKTQNETRIGEILKSVENGWSKRAEIVNVADKISKYFISVVFFLSGAVFVFHYLNGNTLLALEMSIALLIVTCPCALALAVPLTFLRSLSLAAKNGIVIKNESALQKLSQIKNVFLDKTGTITQADRKLCNFKILKETKTGLKIEDIIYTLETNSQHPSAKSLVYAMKLKNAQTLPMKNYVEKVGVGVEGQIHGSYYLINKRGLSEDSELIASFDFQDFLQPESIELIKNLNNLKISTKVLSGDNKIAVEKVTALIGLNKDQYIANVSPEEKSTIVKNYSNVMMVGDGANDTIAFANSHVGVAVMGAMDMALRSSDVYLVVPGLSAITKLLILAQETMKVIYRNIILSLIYNCASVSFVFLGWITPLTAAIIMPLSSLSVLVSTIYGTKKIRQLWKS